MTSWSWRRPSDTSMSLASPPSKAYTGFGRILLATLDGLGLLALVLGWFALVLRLPEVDWVCLCGIPFHSHTHIHTYTHTHIHIHKYTP
jgi:hypothetical protein